MIRTFRRLFESTVATAARAEEAEAREHGYHVATAALLVEVMRADYEVRREERDAVLHAPGSRVRRPHAGRSPRPARAGRGAGR